MSVCVVPVPQSQRLDTRSVCQLHHWLCCVTQDITNLYHYQISSTVTLLFISITQCESEVYQDVRVCCSSTSVSTSRHQVCLSTASLALRGHPGHHYLIPLRSLLHCDFVVYKYNSV